MDADEWIAVHRAAHHAGVRSTATMMYGHVETDDDLVEHLARVRDLQDETGGFTAFIPWSFAPGGTPLGRKLEGKRASANRYLRILAASRLFLDNVDHVDASWFSEGKKVGQVALHFGADDFGGTLFEENVMQEAGHYARTSIAETQTMIREAGFVPAQRNTFYEILRTFDGRPSAPEREPVMTRVAVGHSPDADDAFMFYALAHGKVTVEGLPSGGYSEVHADIQALNRRAFAGDLDMSQVSAGAYPYVADRYRITACGCSMGLNYGPIVVARSDVRRTGGHHPRPWVAGRGRAQGAEDRGSGHRVVVETRGSLGGEGGVHRRVEAGQEEAPARAFRVGEDRPDLVEGLSGAEDRLVEPGPLAPRCVEGEFPAHLGPGSSFLRGYGPAA